MIYHIAARADWDRRTDTYAPADWHVEGFVHCSTEDQVVRTANRAFRGRQDLVLLEVDPGRLSPLVVWEDTAGVGEDYPHVYGPIDIAAVMAATPFKPSPDGSFDWWARPM